MASWADPSDYWFNRVPPNQSPLPAIHLGAQLVRQRAADTMREKELELETQKLAITVQDIISKREIQNKIMAGDAELATVLAKVQDWTSPETKQTIFEIGSRYPVLLSTPHYMKALEMTDAATKSKAQADYWKGIIDSRKAAEKSTAAMTNIDAANSKDQLALEIEESDPAQAEALRRDAALLRSTLTSPSETIETGTDENGRQTVRITKGPTPAKGLTAPTQSQIQQRLIAAEKTVGMGAELLSKLSDADVGVRGNINQVVINEGLAQLVPGLHKGSVTDARTLLGQFNESVIKSFASDPRISDKDLQRYKKILPSLDSVESIQSAKEKIGTFLKQIRENVKVDTGASGAEVPKWALSVEELRERIKSGKMTEDEAVQIMVKYH